MNKIYPYAYVFTTTLPYLIGECNVLVTYYLVGIT